MRYKLSSALLKLKLHGNLYIEKFVSQLKSSCPLLELSYLQVFAVETMAEKEASSDDQLEFSSEPIKNITVEDVKDRNNLEESAMKEADDYFNSSEFKARERRVLRKLDFYIAPLLGSLNFLSYIDRSNIGFAATQGMADDLHLAESDLNIAISTFYVLYVLSELPISMYAKQWRFERVLPSLTIAFGLITLGGGFINNSGGLIGTRIILGWFQGCLFPALALFICNW